MPVFLVYALTLFKYFVIISLSFLLKETEMGFFDDCFDTSGAARDRRRNRGKSQEQIEAEILLQALKDLNQRLKKMAKR